MSPLRKNGRLSALTGLDTFDDDDGPDPSGVQPSPSSSQAEEEVEEYLLHGDPRMPRPSDIPNELSSEPRSFFNARVAKARKDVDLALIADIQGSYQRGTYEALPDLHPLVDKPPHAVMGPYDGNAHPGSLIRAFSNLEHIDTHLGYAIREFNSSIGIPARTWRSLLAHNVPCKCCLCVFSIDRYNSYVVQGKCSMALPMAEVPIHDGAHPLLPARTFPGGYQVPATIDFLDTPTGVAFKQGVQISCLCSRILGLPYGCEFTLASDASKDERAYAYCHFSPPRCGFFLDLLRIYYGATLEMEYPVPLRSHAPYQQDLFRGYLAAPWDLHDDKRVFRPRFFKGYVGDIVEPHFLVENGTILRKLHQINLEDGQLGPKHAPPSPPLHVSRGSQTDPVAPIIPFDTYVSDLEKKAIISWGNAQGVSKTTFSAVIKKCVVCKEYLWARFINEHMKGCGRPDGEHRCAPLGLPLPRYLVAMDVWAKTRRCEAAHPASLPPSSPPIISTKDILYTPIQLLRATRQKRVGARARIVPLTVTTLTSASRASRPCPQQRLLPFSPQPQSCGAPAPTIFVPIEYRLPRKIGMSMYATTSMVPKRPISQSPQTYPTSPVEETSPSAAGGYDIDNPGAPTSGKNDNDEGPLKKKKAPKKVVPTEQYVYITCGRTDSPKWRKGPRGPKTLCNACGLRWAKQTKVQKLTEEAAAATQHSS
ncbi:hypothetical protein B0H13DRAFT_2539789 [Mycena leptocephala]|nr:hypothetical protein B0H13DRAFT_2539789 [Mycena leptocephala]